MRDGNLGFAALCGFREVSHGDGRAVVELDVSASVQNPNGALHGGAIATLVDHAGTIAIMSADRQGRPGVTTDLNCSYFNAGPGGSTVVAEAVVLKIGKTLAFVSVDVRTKDGKLLAQGRMTKYQGG
jgi:acyl-coenzyme A thioesterase 13